MKSLWQQENNRLQNKLQVNERLLKKITLETSITDFDKLFKISDLGRKLALCYGIISFVFAMLALEFYLYSIPAMLGGLAMLWSFYMHLPLEKPQFEDISIMELQKSISRFRIHTAKCKMYDISIVIFWILTLIPVFLLKAYGIAVYATSHGAFTFILAAFVIIVLVSLLGIYGYKKYNVTLKKSEAVLDELIAFEKL